MNLPPQVASVLRSGWNSLASAALEGVSPSQVVHCQVGQQICSGDGQSWCCNSNQQCGSSPGSCD
jgi:hypothetical protein